MPDDAPNCRPCCAHGHVFCGLRAEPLHMICGCQLTEAARRQIERLHEIRWFVHYDPAKKFIPRKDS